MIEPSPNLPEITEEKRKELTKKYLWWAFQELHYEDLQMEEDIKTLKRIRGEK